MDKNIKKELEAKGVIKEIFVEFDSPDLLLSLGGEQDKNLKIIEEYLDISINRQAKGLNIKGQDSSVILTEDLIKQLKIIFQTNKLINENDIKRALKLLSGDRNADITGVFNQQININGRKYSVYPKTQNQKIYIDAIRQNDLTFGIGPAGTGKTYLAMAMAVSWLLSKQVKRIILCRPAVEAGEKLGFLPGDMAEKVNPYLRPLYDALYDLVDLPQAEELIAKEIIEVAPLAFMRGRTLSDAFVILDEAQNTTQAQMKMLLTRLGQGSKCVITGDITQIDLPRGEQSGLKDALRILKNIDGINITYFDETDVVRHKLVSDIILAYQKYEKNQ